MQDIAFFGNQVIAGVTKLGDGNVVRKILDKKLSIYFQNKYPDKKIVLLDQIHSANVAVVDKNSPQIIDKADALITIDPTIILTAQHADCFPVLFFDPNHKVVATAHSGLAGSKKKIVKNVIEKMQENFGVKITDIKIWIGPGGRKCCYHREDEWLSKDLDWQEYSVLKNHKRFLDISGFIKNTLLNNGILDKNIFDSEICSICNPQYHSWRRQYSKDNKKPCDCGISFISLR